MRVRFSDAEDCTPSKFLEAVSRAPVDNFLVPLSALSAYMEALNKDDSRFNRLAASVLGDAFIRTPGHSGEPFSFEEMKKLFRMANGVELRDYKITLEPEELKEHNRRMMIRMYSNHESYLGPVEHSLGRTEILLCKILPAVLGGRDNPLDAFRVEMNIDFQEVRALFLGSYAWMLNRGKEKLPSIFHKELFALTSNPSQTWGNLNKYAKSLEEFQQLSNQVQYGYKEEYDYRYAFSPLRDYPFVQISEQVLVVPVIRNLALAFSDGIYDFLAAHAISKQNGSLFDDIFGEIAEEYVRQRVERNLGKNAYVKLSPLGANQLSPDGFIDGGECIVEIKGKRLPRGVITTGRLDAGMHFIRGKRGIARGIAQLLSESQRIQNGKSRGMSKDSVRFLCLITPDGLPGFHLQPIRNYALKLIKKAIVEHWPDLSEHFDYIQNQLEWLSFEEFDYLCRASCEEKCSIGRLLERYHMEISLKHPLDLKTNELAPNLRAWLLARYPNVNIDPWLRASMYSVMDECAAKLFKGA